MTKCLVINPATLPHRKSRIYLSALIAEIR